MASQSNIPEAPAHTLVLCAKPDAPLAPLGAQPPLFPDGPTRERFVTAHGKMFERHTDAAGMQTWYMVQKA